MIIIYRVKIEVYGNVLVIKKSYISASTVHSYFLEQMVGPYIYVLFHSRNKLSRSGISHTEAVSYKRKKWKLKIRDKFVTEQRFFPFLRLFAVICFY